MGQEQSVLDDDTPPVTLTERSLKAVAEFIKSAKACRIVVLTGAGISTAAGIPDFRSPDTGLYAHLARLNLPYPEAVFDIGFFRSNPEPFYVLAKELYPGNFYPTISHAFIALLAKKGLLLHLFTQNIDCLERAAGVPANLIVEAHGSFATQRCIECKSPYPDDEIREHVFRGDVPRCIKSPTCTGLVKPDIVFFGESLPEEFYRKTSLPKAAELVIVMGTSLTVHPFAALPDFATTETPRVLFNKERTGSFGSRTDDVCVLGDCDDGVRMLADELGWRADLEAEWRRIVGDAEADRQLKGAEKHDRNVNADLDQLVAKVDDALKLNGNGAADDHNGLGSLEQAQDSGNGSGKQAFPSPEHDLHRHQTGHKGSNSDTREAQEQGYDIVEDAPCEETTLGQSLRPTNSESEARGQRQITSQDEEVTPESDGAGIRASLLVSPENDRELA